MGTPKTCKEWKNKIVVINEPLSNAGGDLFHPGELLIVRRKYKNGSFDLARPSASIHIRGGNEALLSRVSVIGDFNDILKCKYDDTTE